MSGRQETFARFIALSSPFWFWSLVSLLAAGIWWLQ